MKILKFMLKVISEGLKVLIPVTVAISFIILICSYLSNKFGEGAAIVFIIIIVFFALSFAAGLIKMENDRLNKLER